MIKISIIGDIMCEGPFLSAASKQKGHYTFDECFQNLQECLSDSDYIVGNIETPFAGGESHFTVTNDLYSFNSPDEFAYSLKWLDLALTANNHCYDRGKEGLIRTLQVLDKAGISHTGTFTDNEKNRIYFTNIKSERVAFISCTASTNNSITKQHPSEQNVNLLDDEPIISKKEASVRKKVKKFVVSKILGNRNYILIRRLLGKSPTKPITDNYIDNERSEKLINNVCELIQKAKQDKYTVIICPHMGGQFNAKPGLFSTYLKERFCQAGADAIVASHPHIIQKFEMNNTTPCFYSLGNVSMSMNTIYILRENLPDYGLIAHLYIEGGKIQQVTGTIIKIIEDETHFIHIWPISELVEYADDEKKKAVLQDLMTVQYLLNVNDIELNSLLNNEFILYQNCN